MRDTCSFFGIIRREFGVIRKEQAPYITENLPTDCNVGNVGAIMGVALGLDCIDASWREPMNDLLITASLIGTRNLLTIPQCVDLICRLAGQIAQRPRYHFLYRGSTNNFQVSGDKGRPIHFLQADYDGVPALKVAIRKLNKKGEIRIFTRSHYRPREPSSNYFGLGIGETAAEFRAS